MTRTRWTVGRRLSFGFALLMALGVAMTLLQAWGTERSVAAMETIYNDRTVPLGDLADVSYGLSRTRIVMMDALLNQDSATVTKRVQQADAALDMAHQAWKRYIVTYLTPEEKALAVQLEQAMAALERQGFAPMRAALVAGDFGAAREALSRHVSPLMPPVSETLGKLFDLQKRVAAEEFAAAEGLTHKLHWISGLAALVAVVLGTGVALAITRGLQRALGAEPDALAHVAQRVATGDLTDDGTPAAVNGSVMTSMQAMRQALVQVVGTVRHGVDSVATASQQIAQGNQDLSGRTEEQASSLQQTAASMEQLTGAVRNSAENARQANQLASGASEVALRGGQVISQVVTTMNEIQDASRRIADITGVIDGIAFQTNILALNAAVEAARAGEQGRGFAVVAGEVRALAQRSAEAAREIKSLIGASVAKVESGGALVQDAGSTMDDIVAQVRRVTDLVAEITASAAEQSQGIAQVGQAMGQLDQTTQQNAALVEESAAAADSLRQQAARLADAVAAFRLDRGPQAAA
jgi:methyl-accepting chemotaxis protein